MRGVILVSLALVAVIATMALVAAFPVRDDAYTSYVQYDDAILVPSDRVFVYQDGMRMQTHRNDVSGRYTEMMSYPRQYYHRDSGKVYYTTDRNRIDEKNRFLYTRRCFRYQC